MKPLLSAQLVNDPFGDPALYVEILWEHRALLFDLGDVGRLRPTKILKISHVFISHTHIDHFVGFDFLLRLMLNREKTLKLYGPPGFLRNIEGKLAGYTWNLTSGYSFAVQASEVERDRIRTQTFPSHNEFIPGDEKFLPWDGLLTEDPHIQVRATLIDHFVPSLAFALQERFHINIHTDRLEQMGLAVGPWLKELKEALWRGESDEYPIPVIMDPPMKGDLKTRAISLGELRETVTIRRGQKIAYVADCLYTPENINKIISLAKGADLFFCEAGFLDEDRDRARERGHLTARQAGELARLAEVKKLIIFHFSPKYEKRAGELYREAEEAFRS